MGAVLTGALVALVALIALTSTGPIQALAAEDGNVRDSIVYLEGGLSIGDRWVPFGSGTACFVGREGEDPSYLVTDDHLLDTFEHFGSGSPETAEVGDDHHKLVGHAAIRAYRKGDPFMETYLVDHDTQSGLVLLKCDRPCEGAVPLGVRVLGDQDHVDDADVRMLVVGYPGFLDEAPDVRNVSADFLEPFVQVGHVSKMNAVSASGVRVIWHDAKVVEGNTGGPIVDEGRAIVAINTWGDGHENYGINAVEVKELLDLNGVAYTLVGAASDTKGVEEEAVSEAVTEAETETTDGDATSGGVEASGGAETSDEDGDGTEDERGSLIGVTSNVPLPAVVALVVAIVCAIAFVVLYPRLRKRD